MLLPFSLLRRVSADRDVDLRDADRASESRDEDRASDSRDEDRASGSRDADRASDSRDAEYGRFNVLFLRLKPFPALLTISFVTRFTN
jgi:hypothetical protein